MARDVGADRLIAAWQTNNRATTYLVEHLPASVWSSQVPGISRLTVGMIAAHEGYHRGQLCMVARQLGQRLPRSVAEGIWQWTRRSRE